MKRQLSKLTRLLLAATLSVFAALLAFGVSAAAAEGPVYRVPLSGGSSSTAAVVSAVVLAIAVAATVGFTLLLDRRRVMAAQVTALPVEQRSEQTRKAA